MNHQGLRCPICHTVLSFGEKMQLWDVEYGEDAVLSAEFPIMINLFCEVCGKPQALVYIERGGMELPPELQKKLMKDMLKLHKKLKKEKN